ncbi:MAG: SDR family NAD(P)-dependent oxidoreductase, partial [Syntrophobacterales bacterium]
MPRLEGKVVVVTGGGSGIGKATALAFAREGALMAVADVEISRGEDTAGEIIATGGRAVFLNADVCNSEQVKNMIDQVVDTYGRLDCAFNNAGIAGVQARTADCTEENWDRIMVTNLKGVWLCMKYEIPQMLKQGGGVIVNTSSVAGLVGWWGWSAYAASKHG